MPCSYDDYIILLRIDKHSNLTENTYWINVTATSVAWVLRGLSFRLNYSVSDLVWFRRGCSWRGLPHSPLIGRQVLANLEHAFDSILGTHSDGDLAWREVATLLLAQKPEDLPLQFNNLARCFFTGFDPGLVVSIDVDQRSVKANRALKESDEHPD